MRTRVFALFGVPMLLLLCLAANGQTVGNNKSSHLNETSSDDDEAVAILEVGASTNWNFNGGAATFAPNLAAECTPIEHWLELEAGVSPFFTRRSTEWETDFLFKKPWTISKKAEFMAESRAAVGTCQAEREDVRYFLRRACRRFHVLAIRAAPFLDGIWSLPTTTVSRAAINSPSECKLGCL
jgi:hypothetical protein